MTRKIILVLLLLPCFALVQAGALDLGTFSFSMDTKITEDGSITDIGLGIMYSDPWGGEIRFRNTQIAKNEEFEIDGVDDSLNAVNETIYEFFLLPIQYRFSKGENIRLWAGAGLYYEYNKLDEKGFFDWPELEDYGRERVNSYTNDFTMHLAGPLLEAGVKYYSEWFTVDFSGGIVPFFFLTSTQKMSMIPFMGNKKADHSQNTTGSPHVFLSLDSILFKYAGLALRYDYTKLQFEFLKPDDGWKYPENTAVTQNLMLEISALIPLGGDMSFQIGYGHLWNFVSRNEAKAVETNKHFLILSGKKIGF